MAYSHTNSKGNTYYLHSKTTLLKSGREQTIYYFAKTVKKEAIDAVPDGYVVSESKNGLPVLKKNK
jgi:YHS domain-containing protein